MKIIGYILLCLATVIRSSAEEPTVDAAVQKILAGPGWVFETGESLPLVESQITEVFLPYLDVDAKVAKKIVSKIMESSERFDTEAYAKVLIFNRMFCKVPERADKEGYPGFGGWLGFPAADKSVNLLYPLTMDKDGRLKVVGVYRGYMGAEYRGVEEFDYLLKRFGRRHEVKK